MRSGGWLRTSRLWSLHDGADDTIETASSDGLLEPEQVAAAALEAIAQERFLVLPHPQVAIYEQRRASSATGGWGGMRRAQAELARAPAPGSER